MIELVVIIAIVGILAALLLPALARAKTQAQRIACLNNLKQLQVCWHLYALDFRDFLPPNNSVSLVDPMSPMLQGAAWCLGNTRTDATTTNIENGLLLLIQPLGSDLPLSCRPVHA